MSSQPLNNSKIRAVIDVETSAELVATSPERMYQLQTLGVTGRPQFFSTYAGLTEQPEVALWPTPDRAYSLKISFEVRPTEMSADADVPSLPDEFTTILVDYALFRAYRAEDDRERATAFYQDYQSGIRELRSLRKQELPDTPKQVPGTWGSLRTDGPWDLL
jgi:hypothetical protein